MSNPFFDRPILNFPYEYPRRHWELDDAGQPTQKIVESRRGAKFITPIPKPKKRRAATAAQTGFIFDEGKGLSTKDHGILHVDQIIESVAELHALICFRGPRRTRIA